MTIHLNPYLGFRGNAREAMEFYHSVFGGELAINTFAEFQASQDPVEDNLIMHAQLTVEGGLVLMGSDTPPRMEYNPGTNISVSLSGENSDETTLTGYWNKLIEGGQVTQPLTKAQWGDQFGMCIDKFGIVWLLNIAAPVV
ncbi:MAG TPA: VOC family protein [Galbitalea sp.]